MNQIILDRSPVYYAIDRIFEWDTRGRLWLNASKTEAIFSEIEYIMEMKF